MSYLIDTHCHLHHTEWFSAAQATAALADATSQGVRQIVCIGTDPDDSLAARDFANQHDNVYWTYGIHPESADQYQHTEIPSTLADTPIAIGEIGLDYHYAPDTRSAQIHLFEAMLQLALTYQLPVSLHVREAFHDLWPILDNFPNLSGVVHSFTGSKRDLRLALERGFYIGINGLATYTTTPLPPLENMILETDAPFLTPVPNRGTMNVPGNVRLVADFLAVKLGVDQSIIAEQTTKNAIQLFHFQPPRAGF